MTIKEFCKKVEGMNEVREFSNETLLTIGLEIDHSYYKATSYKELLKILKEQYVETYYEAILKIELEKDVREYQISFVLFGELNNETVKVNLYYFENRY